ncbi:MAG: LCP family protein [Candidatus Moraniibacteriota bacterium]|jgi:LCP family protein required for cell wall assembly
MDIIRKQKKNPSVSKLNSRLRGNDSGGNFHDNDSLNGAYSNTNHNRTQKIQTLDEYSEIKQSSGVETRLIASLPKTRSKKIFWISLVLFILAILFAGGFFIHNTNNTINQITDGEEKHSFMKTVSNFANPQSYKVLHGFDTGRINILLLGRANTHKKGGDLTDTIMLASINTEDYTVGLFSIPRDFLVSNGSFYSKINSRYQTGLRNDKGAKYIINSVEKITDQNVDYYFVLDFEGFTKIVDMLGGINVDVPKHIKDERYPGAGYTYETFEVYPGLQKFDGTTALKYARTRHADIEGDFGRAKRQQQVMQAARNKAFSLGTIMNPLKITELLNILGEHVHTDVTPDEIEPFISLIKKLDTHNINNVVLDAWKSGSLLISARYHNAHGGISGLVPRSGTYAEIQDQAKNLFDLDKIKQRQDEIEDESPTIILINTTSKNVISARVKTALLSLGFDDVIIKSNNYNTQNKTTIIDNTGGIKTFSLDELIKKLPAKKDTQAKTKYEDTDFVILLGSDMVDAYTYTEISQEELESENAQNNDK